MHIATDLLVDVFHGIQPPRSAVHAPTWPWTERRIQNRLKSRIFNIGEEGISLGFWTFGTDFELVRPPKLVLGHAYWYAAPTRCSSWNGTS